MRCACSFLPAFVIMLVSTVVLCAGEATTTPAVHSPQRHAGFLDDIKAKNGDIDLVFVGDSITDGWRKGGLAEWDQSFAPLKALNLGSSGDRTEHVLWRLRDGELDGYQAKLFVVMIGTNNTKSNRDSAQAIANGIEAIVKEIQAKQTMAKILLLGIFPRGPRTIGGVADDGVKKMETIRAINADLAQRNFGSSVRYLDITGDSWWMAPSLPRSCPINCIRAQRAIGSGLPPCCPSSMRCSERSDQAGSGIAHVPSLFPWVVLDAVDD